MTPATVASPRPAARACKGCGYELGGLDLKGVCPECATPLALSLSGDLLGAGPIGYVRRLRRGCLAATIANWLFLAFTAITMTAAVITMARAGGATPAWLQGKGPELLFESLSWAMFALSLYGHWLATTRDPGQPEQAGQERARRLVRWGLVAATALSALSTIMLFMTQLGLTGRAIQLTRGLAQALSYIAWLVAASAFARFVWHLAPRIPDPALAKFAKPQVWTQPVLGTAGLLLCGLGLFAILAISLMLFGKLRRALRAVEARMLAAASNAGAGDGPPDAPLRSGA